MRRDEEHFHTPEQVAGHLDDALAIIAATEIPEDLRVAAFTKTYELLAGKQVFFHPPQSVPIDPRILRG